MFEKASVATMCHRKQVATIDGAEAIKASVAVLKKVCRQRTMVAWKEWRASMEAHSGASLRVRTRTRG